MRTGRQYVNKGRKNAAGMQTKCVLSRDPSATVLYRKRIGKMVWDIRENGDRRLRGVRRVWWR